MMIFSKDHTFRIKGLEELVRELSRKETFFNHLETNQICTGILGAVRYTTRDTMQEVSINSMKLLCLFIDALSTLSTKPIYLFGDSLEYVKVIMENLLFQICSKITIVKDEANSTYLKLTESELVSKEASLKNVFDFLNNHQTKENYLIGSLELLIRMIETFDVKFSDSNRVQIFEYTGPNIKKNKIRMLSKKLLCIYNEKNKPIICLDYDIQAKPFIDIISENICKQIFSTNREVKKKGLQSLFNELSDKYSWLNSKFSVCEIYIGIFGVVNHTIKYEPVALESMNLLELLINILPPKLDYKKNKYVAQYIKNILPFIIEYSGNSNDELKEKAQDTFKTFITSKIVNINESIDEILKIDPIKPDLPKKTLAKIELLKYLVPLMSLPNSKFQYIASYANINESRKTYEIKQAAFKLLNEIPKNSNSSIR
ncbi:hypothetical protein SteCoe_15725 [Stentor coeruleus]|uniref:MMS19 nucleotide excision repair protein n=1 Tax=Stentor coeruleus TaxID=5963 RepID=A0A1R2C351_9CILI|nr:hypothetical protein SteCoe_15725 [Stentor coeruleus]